MTDYKDQLMELVDLYALTDDTLRLETYTQIENAFFDRLQASLLTTLPETQRGEIFKAIDAWEDMNTISEKMRSLIVEPESFTEKVLDEFIEEFKTKFTANQ